MSNIQSLLDELETSAYCKEKENIEAIRADIDEWLTLNAHDEDVAPSHYEIDGLRVDSIDIVRGVLGEQGFIDFCHGNILKYAIRAKKKGKFSEDMKKIRVYAKWISEMVDGWR